MFPNYKAIEDLTQADILSLLGEEESSVLDFKQDAYEDSDPKDHEKWKRELCKDISALANASRGWIICGIVEDETGTAIKISGLGANFNADNTIQRLEECALRGIEPRIRGLKIHPVKITNPDNQDVQII